MLPKRVIIEKEGNATHVIDCATQKVIHGLKSVKIDMTDGKDLTARITFDVPIEDIKIVNEQLELPGLNGEAKADEADETEAKANGVGHDPLEWEAMPAQPVKVDGEVVDAEFTEPEQRKPMRAKRRPKLLTAGGAE